MTLRRACLTLHRSCLLAALLVMTSFGAGHAQGRESVLSDREVDTLRETAYEPPERLLAFIRFLDQRAATIDKLNTGKRQPGREEDLHDQMEQIASIADDLDDNLSDYRTRHLDVRKALPKVIAAVERWATAVRTPPDHAAYNVQRTLALESLGDVRESATKLLDEQRAYFLAHPPVKASAAERRFSPR